MKVLVFCFALIIAINAASINLEELRAKYFESSNATSSEEVEFAEYAALMEKYQPQMECMLTKYEDNRKKFDEHIERATAYLEKITELDEDATSAEEFQMLEKVCVDGKSVIHEIFEDSKFLIQGCLQDSENTINMILNFIEKLFEFACSLKEKDFDVLEDEALQECIVGNIEEYSKCYSDFPLSETDDSLCSFNQQGLFSCGKRVTLKCAKADNVIIRVIDFFKDFFAAECKVGNEIADNQV